MEHISKKWYREATPLNARKGSINIGAGDNGIVSISYDKIGLDGNDYSLEVVTQVGNNLEMSAVLAGTKLTITLGTDALGDESVTSNTALLISGAVDALPEFVSTYSGTGETPIVTGIEETSLNGGQLGTYCPVPFTYLQDETYYYVNIAANGDQDANWRRFTLASY